MDLIKKDLLRNTRPPDGLLHASGDLVGPLRHSQLRLAGAPMKPTPIAQQLRLETGTMWHDKLHDVIVQSGALFMQEVSVTPWLPEGWGGTADWVFHDDKAGGFVLADLKTIKPEGLRWIERDGAKTEHMWQLSAYWHALVDAGFPMVEGFTILYLPMADTTDDTVIEPMLVECSPLSREVVHSVMEDRWALTEEYLSHINDGWTPQECRVHYVNDYLAPIMEREQKTYWNSKQSVWDVKLVPHWSSMFCPFENDLCDCSEQGVTKIGHFALDGTYFARNGYEDVEPTIQPAEKDIRARREAVNA